MPDQRKFVLAPSTLCSLDKTALVGIPLAIDDRGFVYARGLMIGRYLPREEAIQFIDKDRLRSGKRGSEYITVPLKMFAEIMSMFDLFRDQGPPDEMRAP